MKIEQGDGAAEIIAKVNRELEDRDMRFVEIEVEAGEHGWYQIEDIHHVIALDMDDEHERFVLADLASAEQLTVALSDNGVEKAVNFILERPSYTVDEGNGSASGEEVFNDFVQKVVDRLEKRLNPFDLDNNACRRVYQVMESPNGLLASTLGPIVRRQCQRLVERGVLRLVDGHFQTATKFRRNPFVQFYRPGEDCEYYVGGAPGPADAHAPWERRWARTTVS